MFRRRASMAAVPSLVIEQGGNKPKRITQVFGAGGMGKTLYVKHVLRSRLNAGGRAVVLDPNATFGSYGRVVSVPEAVAVLRSAGARRFALMVRPAWDEEVGEVFGAAFEAGGLLLVADEAADYGGRLALEKNFLRLVQKGRNRLVDVATTCQGCTDLDVRVRRNFSTGICFGQATPESAERFAVEYARRPELSAVLLKLPRFRYVRAEFGGAVQVGTLPDPAKHGEP